ncbi:MAG: amidohydrolase family protein [bacterium]|jgi:cytosine/adenosine deaminase-related metal-dependent hydrolase
MMPRLIIHGGMIMTFINEAYEALKVEEADILIEGGEIKEINRGIAVEADDRVIDATGKLIIPGLINAHNHCLTTAVCRGMTDDYNRERYGGSALYSRVFPLKRIALTRLAREELSDLLRLTLAEMINSGTTAVVEQCTGQELEIFIELAAALGLRAGIAPMFTSGEHLPEVSADGKIETGVNAAQFKALEDNVRLFEQYNGVAEGRISIWLGPHAPDSCSAELLKEVRRAADASGMRIMTHLAQTRVEMAKIKECFAATPTEYLERLGFLGPDVVAAHALFTDAADREIIKANGVSIAHCPQVFAKGGMLAPFQPFKEMEINVALGTDSYAVDALAEMRMAALMGKLQTSNAHSVSATDAFFAATVGGAIAFARNDIGRIAPGLRADLAILNFCRPHIQPVVFPVINLVYHALSSDVEYVIIDGKVVKEGDRIFGLEQAEMMEKAARVIDKVWGFAREGGVI